MPLLLKNISVAHPAKACLDEVKGRTPVILSSENSNQAACTGPPALNGYTHPPGRDTPLRRPPPYRSVPFRVCRNSRSRPTGESVAADCPMPPVMRSNRARSVPAQSTSTCFSDVKPVGRPKSLHQQQLLCGPVAPAPYAPLSLPSVDFFPHSVSLQFDALPDWPQNHCPVPSPAPTERRSCHRSTRAEYHGANKCTPSSRSSSLPRPNSPPRTMRNRPLSHPAGSFSSGTLDTSCRSSLNSLRKSETNPSVRSISHCLVNQLRWPGPSHHALLHGLQGSTPAPAPSPSSTPSPSRLLAHLPSDALRGVRTLERKLELYVDILQSQERFVQVLPFLES